MTRLSRRSQVRVVKEICIPISNYYLIASRKHAYAHARHDSDKFDVTSVAMQFTGVKALVGTARATPTARTRATVWTTGECCEYPICCGCCWKTLNIVLFSYIPHLCRHKNTCIVTPSSFMLTLCFVLLISATELPLRTSTSASDPPKKLGYQCPVCFRIRSTFWCIKYSQNHNMHT